MKRPIFLILLFALGFAAGAVTAKKRIDPGLYRGQEKAAAGEAVLALAKERAGRGSWENIAVGRVYYLAGMKSEGQAIFDSVTSRKPEASDWLRLGRVYYAAGEWDKAKAAFDKVILRAPKDAPWLAENGGYYNSQGEREKAEELFERSLELEPGHFWSLVNIAGSYFGQPWE